MHKRDLLLLHGALGSASQFDTLIPHLDSRFSLHTLDFEGHGPQPSTDRPFRIEHFAENVLAYLDTQAIERIDIFGYSMGGYVAVYLATTHPMRVGRVLTLGTKYLWTPDAAVAEMDKLLPDKIQAKVPAFATALETLHTGSGWRMVVDRTREMIGHLGERNLLTEEALASVKHPVHVTIGDRDITVSVEEADRVYRALPQGELEVLPDTPHPLDRVAPARLAESIMGYFDRGD